jgi:hypothetical protein
VALTAASVDVEKLPATQALALSGLRHRCSPTGQQRQPNQLRPRPPAPSLNKTNQAKRKRVKDADQKKTNAEEDTRSLRPKKNTFGLPLTISHRRGLAVSAPEASICGSLVSEGRRLPASVLRIIGSDHAEVWVMLQRQLSLLTRPKGFQSRAIHIPGDRQRRVVIVDDESQTEPGMTPATQARVLPTRPLGIFSAVARKL